MLFSSPTKMGDMAGNMCLVFLCLEKINQTLGVARLKRKQNLLGFKQDRQQQVLTFHFNSKGIKIFFHIAIPFWLCPEFFVVIIAGVRKGALSEEQYPRHSDTVGGLPAAGTILAYTVAKGAKSIGDVIVSKYSGNVKVQHEPIPFALLEQIHQRYLSTYEAGQINPLLAIKSYSLSIINIFKCFLQAVPCFGMTALLHTV